MRISDWSSDVCSSDLSLRRRACRTVLDRLFECLTVWLGPIVCFTAEEAWLARTGDAPGNSVHLQTCPDIPEAWRDDALAERWAKEIGRASCRERVCQYV